MPHALNMRKKPARTWSHGTMPTSGGGASGCRLLFSRRGLGDVVVVSVSPGTDLIESVLRVSRDTAFVIKDPPLVHFRREYK
jgi:hypothetical protein